ncbi:MAG: hypothetical protein JO303_00585, partial [Caulobacteraceae bacterium]|nr:hypothetical protein [Caulobacteraceae bacterium]
MAEDQTPGGFPQLASWSRPDRPYPGGGAAYGTMIEALRDFLDHLAGSKPDEATIAALGEDLKAWSERLAPLGVRETEQIWGRRHDLPGRGQALWPPLTDIDSDESSVSATVYFGRRYLGGNGAVHGGALPLLFDEVLGQLSNIGGRSRARTAYLH